jgi:hypothetical protein
MGNFAVEFVSERHPEESNNGLIQGKICKSVLFKPTAERYVIEFVVKSSKLGYRWTKQARWPPF